MKTKRILCVVALVLGGTVIGLGSSCSRDAGTDDATNTSGTTTATDGSTQLRAVAQLEPTQGNKARGTVRFSSEGNAVRVTADITGLTPGEHGFHVHEKGDCSAPDASSAGGHFNPDNQPHGARDAEARHVGDLGNLTADDKGRAQLNYLDQKLSLSGPNTIIGRAVIVHAGRDDLKSQPAGDAGGRVACGAIEQEQ
jgi:Cu-Zn family superoxide dismutase